MHVQHFQRRRRMGRLHDNTVLRTILRYTMANTTNVAHPTGVFTTPSPVQSYNLPGQHEQEQGHAQVRGGRVHPHAERQRVQEPEQLRLLLLRFRVQYADAQRHERRREVHRGPPVERDGQVAYGQIGSLKTKNPR